MHERGYAGCSGSMQPMEKGGDIAMFAIRGYDETYLSIRTPDVLALIQTGDPSWEQFVPPAVADLIMAEKLSGYAEASGPACRLPSAGDAG